VTDCGTNGKPIDDFLLANNTNLRRILHRLRDIGGYWSIFWPPTGCLTHLRGTPARRTTKFRTKNYHTLGYRTVQTTYRYLELFGTWITSVSDERRNRRTCDGSDGVLRRALKTADSADPRATTPHLRHAVPSHVVTRGTG